MTQTVDMIHPPVGAHLEGRSCHFNVWAPLKEKVELILEPSGSSVPMTRDHMGYWHAKVDQVSEGQLYKFRVEGKAALPDPASRSQPQGVHGPSAVVASAFNWSDKTWRGIPLSDMVIYELHVGTFTPARNFDGVIEKLSYLKDLGINAIELLPVAQFPGDRNWGYDGVYPFAAQHSYGGPQGLKRLADAAHKEGIAVILDVVYNHQGPEGNYLGEYGPYFTDKYKTGWGQAINFDDAWCDGVRNFYWQNALTWLDEFHIDGLRLDAVHAIWDFSANHFIEELSGKVQELQARVGAEKVLIAEFDLNNPRYILPRDKGGYGLDGQWIDEYHHALHSLITGEVDGYYEDFGSLDQLAKALKDSYVYTGQYSPHRKKHFGKNPLGTHFGQFVVFIQNHDQTGNRMLGDRLASLVPRESLKLAAAAYLLSPYVPMLFMGEEYGEKNPFQYFISHTDEKLVELVRKGRKQEFSYFKWEGEVPDPQSEETFKKCILSWPVDQDPDATNLLNFYRRLIALRKDHPAMRNTQRDSLEILASENGLLSFLRKAGEDQVLIVLNFNKQPADYTLSSGGPSKLLLDSSAGEWGGPARTNATGKGDSQVLTLQPLSVMIFHR